MTLLLRDLDMVQTATELSGKSREEEERKCQSRQQHHKCKSLKFEDLLIIMKRNISNFVIVFLDSAFIFLLLFFFYIFLFIKIRIVYVILEFLLYI